MTAPEPRTIVRHRSNAARRYPVAVAMLFLLASVPMLAAVLVGSASLDGRARPRTPFVAGPPGHQVIVPGDASDPDYARRPLDASPLPARNGFPPGKAPVRTGHNTPIPPPPAGGSVVGAPPAGSGDAAGPGSGPGSSRGGGRNGGPGGGGTGGDPGGGSPGGGNTGSDPAGPGGTPITPTHGDPECSTPPPTGGPEQTPTPSPKPSPSRTNGGLVGGLLGGVVGLIS